MIKIEVSPGELFDKMTILEIKSERMTDSTRLANVRAELELLRGVARESLPTSPRLDALVARLRKVNDALWHIEDEIRAFERRRDFGEGFIHLARSVYRENDRRAAIKREINQLLKSRIMEEKAYAPY